MAAKLGSDDVSFRLGSATPAKVFRGLQEVWSAAPPGRTFWFKDLAWPTDWSIVENWAEDAAETITASVLPGPNDDVVMLANVDSNSGAPAVVRSLTTRQLVGIPITASVQATFNNSARLQSTVTTPTATFNNDSNILTGGVLDGNATFNDVSANRGTVTGDATFTGSACNSGTVNGSIIGSPASCP